MTAKILIACGSGVATSTLAVERLKKIARKQNLDWEVTAVDFRSLKTYAKSADVLVTIAPKDTSDWGIPVVDGSPLLTGYDVDKVVEHIKEAVE